MNGSKQARVLELFFRGLRGEDISVSRAAADYGVSSKSVTRDIDDLKAFLADHRELVGNTELNYSYQNKCYRLEMDEFLSSKELFALTKVLIGARAFSASELLAIIGKLKRFTSVADRAALDELIKREIYNYPEVRHDCESVEDNLWQLAGCIRGRREISIDYHRMDRSAVTRRIRPVSLMFTEYYFYLIAFAADRDEKTPIYFRADRITNITEHRKVFGREECPEFDEGELRRRSLFMWPGKLRRIRFEFCGPSVQAVLDRLPTARVIGRNGNVSLIEAEVYGDGIKMWLMSQGSWVKVVAPEEFVTEMRLELEKTLKRYGE